MNAKTHRALWGWMRFLMTTGRERDRDASGKSGLLEDTYTHARDGSVEGKLKGDSFAAVALFV